MANKHEFREISDLIKTDVNYGDLIQLVVLDDGKRINEVAGYMSRTDTLESGTVQLCTENPRQNYPFYQSAREGRREVTTYLIDRFTHYRILQKYNE